MVSGETLRTSSIYRLRSGALTVFVLEDLNATSDGCANKGALVANVNTNDSHSAMYENGVLQACRRGARVLGASKRKESQKRAKEATCLCRACRLPRPHEVSEALMLAGF